MKKFLMAAVVAIVTVSITDYAVCQYDQYSGDRYPADRVARLPASANSGHYRGRDWRPRYPQNPTASIAQNYSDSAPWNAQGPPLNYSNASVSPRNVAPSLAPPQTEFFPSVNTRSVVTREPMLTSMPFQESSFFQGSGSFGNRTGGSKAFSNPWSPSGSTPFINGNIFGVGDDECCDEWANHCPCLELTNGRSNCDCSNPYRSNNEPCRHGYRQNQTDCQGCDRSASRSTVSDYFHPGQSRR